MTAGTERGARPLEQVLHALSESQPRAFFIQVGANDGMALDPLRHAVTVHGWSGILVEPVPYVFDRLVANYAGTPGLIFENVAIADADGERELHYLPEAPDDAELWQWYHALASFDREVLLSHRRFIPDIDERVATMAVPCVTFDTLCARHSVERVDVVQIDTEGYDDKVLDLIDLARYRVQVVMYEHLHLTPADRARCTRRLEAEGFAVIADGMDTLAVRRGHLAADRSLRQAWRKAARASRVGGLRRVRGTARRLVRRSLDRALAPAGLRVVSAREGDEYTSQLADTAVPLPPGAAEALRYDHPRLLELKAAYDALDWPVARHSRWDPARLESWLDLQRFRGDTSYIWHYRESRRVSELKYFAFLCDVERRDERHLLRTLGEDGSFGCWTYRFEGRPTVSRDLLDSVNELSFLHRHLGLLDRSPVRILDIGAGYGRLAHRAAQAIPGLDDYCCVDAVAVSTYLSEVYLAHRGVVPPARVVPLADVPSLPSGHFDLAVNVHSFSECPLESIEWWLSLLERLEVPHLFVVPNEPDGFRSLELDGQRLDYLSAIEGAGFVLVAEEPAIADPGARALLGLGDRHHLFARR